MHDRESSCVPLWRVLIAFAAVYSIWGSTYLAIRVGVSTIPPFLMAGVRFIIAGGALYAWTRIRGATKPTLIHWRSAAIIGGLLLCCANGGVCWSEQYVESSVAALLVATVPLWMVLLNWVRPGGVRPTRLEAIGLLVGFGGVALLVNPSGGHGSGNAYLLGQGVLVFASLLWATGSLYSRHAPLPKSQLLSTAMQMICGGVLLATASIASGELTDLDLRLVTLRSVFALAYLIVFGALIGFTAYMWLLRVSTPAKVSTYAYVNPVVAVILGWAILSEPLDLRTFVAMGIIVSAVALITARRRRAPQETVRTPAQPRPVEPSPVMDSDASASCCAGAAAATSV